MKKKFLYSLIAYLSVVSIGAYAADPEDPKAKVLTTQRYVDDGLEFVYKVANGTENGAVKTLQTNVSNLQTDVGNLADEIGNYSDTTNDVQASGIKADIEALDNAIGTTGTGLTGRVESLENKVGDSTEGLVKEVDDVKGALSDGNGGLINVGQLKNTVDTLDSLNTDDLDKNKTYVLKTDANGDGSWSELKTVNDWNPTL